jgi:urea carboxylase
MKTEFPVASPAAGTVVALYVAERQSVNPGAPMMALVRA